MLFNHTYRLGNVLAPLTQEEILNTPEFYAMSREAILASPRCPAHLARILLELPFGGRPSVVQVRPQDFRGKTPHILGTGWHVDLNTALSNGRMHNAKCIDEFTSMVVSFGDVADTQFLKGPLEIDTARADPFDHCAFADYISRTFGQAPTVTTKPNQVASYTSRDIHRVNPNIRPGRGRIIIVTFECDDALEADAGRVGPSILERG